MPAAYQELFIEQGTDFTTSITLDDVYGIPFNLTGNSVKSQIKKSYYSSNVVESFNASIPSPQNGVISLTLSSANSANIFPGRYVYDVVIKDSANNVTRVLEGIITIDPKVTGF
jgi:hypothetical protein